MASRSVRSFPIWSARNSVAWSEVVNCASMVNWM
jgi:hypothetical protein